MEELNQALVDLEALINEHPQTKALAEPWLRSARDHINSALAAVRREVERLRELHEPDAGLLGLPGIVDLTAPAPMPAAALAAADNVAALAGAVDDIYGQDGGFGEFRVFGDGDEEDLEPIPSAELTATITGATNPADAAYAVHLATVAIETEAQMHYTVVDGAVTTTGATLTAKPDQGFPEGSIPAGTVVFRGTNPETGIEVTLAVAGEPDPDAPAWEPNDVLARLIEMAQDYGDPVPDVDEVRLVLEALDSAELTLDDAQRVLHRALEAFNAQMGEHVVRTIDDGPAPTVKVARLIPVTDGAVDRRTLAVGITRFAGTLPFPTIGRVRAHAEVG